MSVADADRKIDRWLMQGFLDRDEEHVRTLGDLQNRADRLLQRYAGTLRLDHVLVECGGKLYTLRTRTEVYRVARSEAVAMMRAVSPLVKKEDVETVLENLLALDEKAGKDDV